MRGYGLSDKPQGLAAVDCIQLGEDITAAVAHAAAACGNSAKPLLVAHDWGAAVCWSWVCYAGGKDRVAGYCSLSNAPSEAFAKSLTSLSQIWASAYMIFFNAPYLPEWLMLAGSAWFTALILNDCQRGGIETPMMNAYRANVLQPGAMTTQLNYYRQALAGGSAEARAAEKGGRLGGKDGPS